MGLLIVMNKLGRSVLLRFAAAARRLHRDERGAGIMWFATFTLVALIGGAIAIDFGDVTVERREQQKSADSIVLAGVQELPDGSLLADQYAREVGTPQRGACLGDRQPEHRQ